MVNLDSYANVAVLNNKRLRMNMAANPNIDPLLNPGAANVVFNTARGLGITKGIFTPTLVLRGAQR